MKLRHTAQSTKHQHSERGRGGRVNPRGCGRSLKDKGQYVDCTSRPFLNYPVPDYEMDFIYENLGENNA